ncbi:BCCT family transporter [Arcanobacterium wilhelmae]|uniref:BCCT family transporter n=1 Tax=Arcanobacterium wilhelmae TaxID=1803177 RepID=UPI002415656F|nr:BCCT family transporter [Arcanobacterium wilhelmae]WFN90097.1 BCCT family transporter [Arcanobacterium wilhelmae]
MIEKNTNEEMRQTPPGHHAENAEAVPNKNRTNAAAGAPASSENTHSPAPENAHTEPIPEGVHIDPATGKPASATSVLAAMISADEKVHVSEYREKPIELASENEDASISWGVVLPAMILVIALVAVGLTAPAAFAAASSAAFTWVITNLGWAFVLFSTAFVLFVVAIAASKFGTIRLGAADEQPEFSNGSWIAMMFAAGMGIGLMFFGAAEPLAFYKDGVPGHQPQEVGTAMATAMFHWTLHPWAMYTIVGLAIAYSTYRIGRKQLISAAFTPLLGEKGAQGWGGKLIDSLSIFATVFGTACSLGLGALQIRTGLKAAGVVSNPGSGMIVGIVVVLTACFLLSAMSGVGRGIRILSNTNMVLAGVLAAFVFVVGPTITELNLLPGSLGAYVSNFFEMAGRTAASADGTAGEWLSGWTIFYWAWWISWSPFVGMFIARISRGRTIRQFAIGVMLVPAGLSTAWFAIFGGTAITMEQNGQSIAGAATTEGQLFTLLHHLPGGTLFGFVALLLLATFFITSADSASTVMGSLSQDGRATASPWISGLWGLLTALIGLVLLVSGGSDALNNIQSVTIVAATPFLFIVFALMFSLVKDLRNDPMYLDQREQERFARRLARERRHLRERAEREAAAKARARLLHPQHRTRKPKTK